MNSQNIIYRQPGDGAIEFAKWFVEGKTQEEAMPIIKRLIKIDVDYMGDKRVKRCSYCGYLYRDKTKPNNSKSCSRECKTLLDTLKRAKKRADAALLKPKKQTKRESNYVWWLEYPYWINEYEMLKQSWKYENPYSSKKIEQIQAAVQRTELMGGKRKPKRVVPYNGDEGGQPKTFVKFTKYSERKPGDIIISYMKPEEISNYFSSKYSERHLALERRRAEFSHSKKV